MNNIQDKIAKTFYESFGRTPLRERLQDILNETIELNKFTDLPNLKEEIGDLLSSAIQLCTECEWNFEERIQDTLTKIQRRKQQYLSLGRKTKVAILGGAFDPITVGHIKLAQFVLDSSRMFDEVWMTPCFSHLYNKKMANSNDRLKMCEIAIEEDRRLKVFNYEIINQLRGETYHFVKRLLEEPFAKDTYDFSIIIGLDNANTFDKWVNYELLEKMIRFVVVPRKGVERNTKVDWYLKPPHIFLSPENTIPEVSSTQVRDIIKKIPIEALESMVTLNCSLPGSALLLRSLVNEEVIRYIVAHKLYQEYKLYKVINQ